MNLSLRQRAYLFFTISIKSRIRRWIDYKGMQRIRMFSVVGSCGEGLSVNGEFSGFGKHVYLKDYVSFNNNVVIYGKGSVHIGSYFHSGINLMIITSNHNFENAESIPYDKKRNHKSVKIGDFVWCGNNVTIIPGVTIGEGVIIAAGSVVVKDLPDYAIAGGNPAVVIRFRNKEEFLKLKYDQKYL